MKYEEIVAKVKKAYAKADTALVDEHLAVQVDVTGEGEGAFYIEVADGKINVEPYEYNDRNCAVTMSLTDFNKLIDGKLDPVLAFTMGKLKVDGDMGKALEFANVLKK